MSRVCHGSYLKLPCLAIEAVELCREGLLAVAWPAIDCSFPRSRYRNDYSTWGYMLAIAWRFEGKYSLPIIVCPTQV